MRQIVLDTETTGLEPSGGHRIIEVGCVELINRKPTGKTYHRYVNPQRDIDAEAVEVHGITKEFLADKPLFADIVHEFQAFIRGAELVIHNAPFDVGFMNHEFALCRSEISKVSDICSVVDTLVLARQLHPGQKNNLNALCRRYGIDNSKRELHGALLDSEILADVYLFMTGGQTSLMLGQGDGGGEVSAVTSATAAQYQLVVQEASAAELEQHEAMLNLVDKKSGGSVWRNIS
ncbi:MAG: DNA polymerase III subunit epsilon [Motiliproteus sp.]